MNTDENTWGLPRELIPWGPTVDPSRCRGSGECVRFCPNNVYEFEESTRKARVANYHQCTVMCCNCVAVCPNGAISFPEPEQFLDAVQAIKRTRTASA